MVYEVESHTGVFLPLFFLQGVGRNCSSALPEGYLPKACGFDECGRVRSHFCETVSANYSIFIFKEIS
jgi:hypothetical protein